ncbi:peptidoglycan editing factor PgeF [Pseudonocardia sp. KRD-184]|uniref:Purine nucleoside phosphorylase n=1 Tax=Pseudonocardia oceani TaxID=2792013 RepID=A0ABS6UFM3_9PSEU|nr:peptidoglycan editing factor PgeF [Pseudonocardia oceani]MBW0093302.1 peptidoglycan editing factor PgeF [Pseudonocardia oceani]MBW0099197.1 peptidoglycan editing factor PgeF [Pseudonocardia oceani]MBW0111823.1 peptidoglycan editing factor PgeF [Pseudonocardia oceani]MBW0125376.1 peptidoglycan editing factor PgeF [Pseudonocardia oceani]MBW0131031.1 peptidoglycan editing factor PgeF [Pseudonocardia oceani]
MSPRVRRVVTTRAGGRSTGRFARFNLSTGVADDPAAVAANRARVSRELGVPVVYLEQVHGTRVETVDAVPATGAPDVPGTDAVVTALPGVGIAVLAADCVPVLLADPRAGVVGAAHAGRVGAAAGVLPAVVEAMVALGARTGDVEVLLGPAVCGGCYEVPGQMAAEVDAALPGSAVRTRRGTPGLDLRAGLYHQLTALGVARIGGDPRCTMETRDLFSHRRDAPTGRQAAITWLDGSR